MISARIEPRYLQRLWGYLWQNKGLLFLTFTCGVIGFISTFIYPWLLGELIDKVLTADAPIAQRRSELVRLTTIGLLTPILFTVAGYGRGHFNMLLGNRIVIALRLDLFSHLQTLSLGYYSKERTGTIVSRLVYEIHAVNDLLHAGMILAAIDVMQLSIALVLLWAISPVLMLTILAILPGYILTFFFLNGRVREASAHAQRCLGRLAGNIQEQVSGVMLTKVFAAEERETAKLNGDNRRHYRYISMASHRGHLVGALSEFFIHLGTGAIIGCTGYLALFAPEGAISPGQLIRFVGYVGILYGPLRRLADLNLVYQKSLAAIRRVFGIFDIKPDILDSPNPVHAAPERGEVTFDHVTFRYDAAAETQPQSQENGDSGEDFEDQKRGWTLEDICFTARPGEKIAVVGHSGSGKTTLVSLIPRLFEVTAGAVRIDGVDVRDYALKNLRSAITIVQQETFLFSGTIRDNISYGKPDASDEEIRAAARAANADRFIAALPRGYATMVGERGVALSGGQKQRIAIARALLCNPRILILDEATSALDSESESLVVEALDRLMEGRTCFIIAHRLSTIRQSDRIFTLEDGKIVEHGAHDELLFSNGKYARLYYQQAAGLNLVADPERKRA